MCNDNNIFVYIYTLHIGIEKNTDVTSTQQYNTHNENYTNDI